MKIIGLTGGIASGKNFVADIFAKNGAAIFDADAEVHKIFDDSALIAKIGEFFPQSLIKASKVSYDQKSKKVDRKILGKIVFSDEKKLKILEEIIHPILRKKYQDFLIQSQKEKRKIILLNIPLLLEKKGYECDKIISLVISPSIQKRRFFARKKDESKAELEKKFKKILQLQLNNKARKEQSDFIVNTGLSKSDTVKQVKKILQKLSN